MISALLLSLLAAAPSHAACRSRARGCGSDSALDRALPTNGAGAPTMAPDICTAFSSELTGNSFCLRGDGTTSGTQTLTAVNSPPTQTPRVCPNGASCGAVSVQHLGGASVPYYKTATGSAPAGDWSVCAVARALDPTANPFLFGRRSTGTDGIDINYGTDGRVTMDVGATNMVVLASGTGGIGPWHLVCATYHPVGAGTSQGNLYIDSGTAASTSSTLALVPATVGIFYVIGTVNQGASGATGLLDIASIMFTEKAISGATIGQMATAVFPGWTTKKRVAVAYARAGTKHCGADDGSLTLLPTDRPCIHTTPEVATVPTVNVEASGTNLNTKMWAFDDVSYTKEAGVTVTANQATGPDSTPTMDLVATTIAQRYAYQTPGPAGAATYIASGYTRASSGTNNSIMASACIAGTASACSCYVSSGSCTTFSPAATTCAAYTATTTTIKRMAISFTCSAGTSSVTNGYSGGTDTLTGSALWTGADFKTGNILTSLVFTDGTAATRNPDPPNIAGGIAGMSNTAGCFGATVFVPYTPSTTQPLLTFASSAYALYLGGSGNVISEFDGVNIVNGPTITVPNTKHDSISKWTGSTVQVCTDGTCAGSGVFDGTLVSTPYRIGSENGTQYLNGEIGNMRFGANTGACNK